MTIGTPTLSGFSTPVSPFQPAGAGGMFSRLAKRNHLTKSSPFGRMGTATHGVDATWAMQTVLETGCALVRIGVPNNLAVDLTGVRVAIASGTDVGGYGFATSVDPTLVGGSWVNCTFTQALNFTAALAAATSGTISANWDSPTGAYSVTFDDGSIRSVTLTNGATTATWTGAVTAGTKATVAGVTNARIGAGFSPNVLDNFRLTWTDYMPLVSPASNDPRGLTPFYCRVQVPAANANVPRTWQNGSVPTIGWATADNVAGRVWRQFRQNVLGVDTKSAFNSLVYTEAGFPIFIQYIPLNAVYSATFAAFGDSTVEGTGAFPHNYGAVWRMQRDLSTPKAPLEICMLAGNGFAASRNYGRFLNLIPEIRPEMALYPIYTVNSAGASAISTSDINGMRYNMSLSRDVASSYDVLMMLGDGLPTNPAARPFGATDALRQDYNRTYSDVSCAKLTTLPQAAVVSGEKLSTGQIPFKLGFSDDNTHPNSTGYEALARLYGAAVNSARAGL